MNARVAEWPVAATASLGLHALAGALLIATQVPNVIEDQPRPDLRLDMTTQEVGQTDAPRREPEADAAGEAAATGETMAQGAIAQSTATPVTLTGTQARPANADGRRVAAAQATSTSAAPANVTSALAPAVTARPTLATSQALPVSSASLMSPTSESAAAPPPRAEPLNEVRQPIQAASPLSASASPVSATTASIAAQPVSSAQPAGELTAAIDQSDIAQPTQTLRERAPVATETVPKADAAETTPSGALASAPNSLETIGTRAQAALAWSGDGPSNIDPVSLAAIREFVGASEATSAEDHAGTVRDGIGASLGAFDCTRIQAEFLPDTGQMRLTGHVPEESNRAEVFSAMQTHIGASIPVVDNLRILPRPQCGALDAIAAVGLPQSNELLTNPRLVGASAHVREYDYVEAQVFSMDIVGTDYDAYIYVDYFDADGNVIHIRPNEYEALALIPADQPITDVGKSLDIRIGPPFGREIAAAFAASEPLYDGTRPLVEPAGAYLDWMRERVAAAREASPDFKGEWVYFLVTTAPAN